MKNRELAEIFSRMADVMEIVGDDKFRINSYRHASRAIDELPTAIEDIAAAGKLQEVEGIGKSTAEKIQQYLATGRIEKYEELLARIPKTLPELLTVPGLGPKTVQKLWKQAKIVSIKQLFDAIEEDSPELGAVDGIGPAKIRSLWQALHFMSASEGRITLGKGWSLASDLILRLNAAGAQDTTAAGSLRRGKETVGDIDILCTAPGEKLESVLDAFTTGAVEKVLARGTTKASVMLSAGVQADLRIVEKDCFGAALAYFTGSKEHNVRCRELAIKKGLKLSEYGLFKGEKNVAGRTEQEIYKALDLEFVPPELREDKGEFAAAADGKLPKLIEQGDIVGDMHMHTVASDGVNTIEEMIAACRDHGYKYLAITEHSRGQGQAGGLDEERLARHVKAIRSAAKKFPDMLVLAGIEVDIFKDGHLDFGADVLAELDWVIASCHSALSMPPAEATERIIKAIRSPHVRCIGHPTCRMINSRPGFELDMDRVVGEAADNDVALEVNSHWVRLDLRDVHVRMVVQRGVKIAINTDAHSTDDLGNIVYGIATARRGWATAADVINAWPVAKLQKWLASGKR